jgi:GH24 family phage-related lysozyme (muramidase)
MIKLRKILKEIMDATPTTNVQQASTNIFSSDFINYIKAVENGRKEGYDVTKKLWFPTKSIEGGFPTIGYGHKIQTNHELEACKKGISDASVTSLLKNDLEIANKRVHDYIKRRYKTDVILSQRQSEMLIDFAFNLGGLDKFPKFTDAVLRNNIDIQRKEYQRNTGGKLLTGRNKAFYDKFLK